MRVLRRPVVCSLLLLGCALAAIVRLAAYPDELRAEARRQVEVFDDCIKLSGSLPNWEISNGCGVRIHASWGEYDSETESGILEYSADIDPGKKVSAYVVSDIHALGCPYTPTPGHPYGYKLAYKDNPEKAVTEWREDGSLICIQW
jgi:hypothetical protein